MGHSYTNLIIHALFGTKGQVPWLQGELKDDLFAYIAAIIERPGGKPLIVGGFSDHIHLLFVLPGKLPLADVMEKVKASSSKWLHERSPAMREFAWQTGYAAFSVS